MRNLLLLLLLPFLYGCHRNSQMAFTPHYELRKLTAKELTESSGKLSGGYFMFVGVIDGKYENTTNIYVRFIYKNKDGFWQYEQQQLSRCRFKELLPNEKPYVCFRYYSVVDFPIADEDCTEYTLLGIPKNSIPEGIALNF